MTARWSMGVLVGLPVLMALFIAGLVGGTVLLRVRRRVDSFDAPMVLAAAIACYVLAFGVALGSLAGYWPYSSDYHKWLPKAGVVKAVNNRFLADGHATSQRFVVEYTDGHQYGCDDTRCSLVKPGDRLTLSCKKEYQYSGVSGWVCSFVRDEAIS